MLIKRALLLNLLSDGSEGVQVVWCPETTFPHHPQRESLMMLPGAEHRKYLNGRRNINTHRGPRMIAAPSSVGVGGVVVVPFILLLISR